MDSLKLGPRVRAGADALERNRLSAQRYRNKAKEEIATLKAQVSSLTLELAQSRQVQETLYKKIFETQDRFLIEKPLLEIYESKYGGITTADMQLHRKLSPPNYAAPLGPGQQVNIQHFAVQNVVVPQVAPQNIANPLITPLDVVDPKLAFPTYSVLQQQIPLNSFINHGANGPNGPAMQQNDPDQMGNGYWVQPNNLNQMDNRFSMQPSDPNQMGTGASIQPDGFNQMDNGLSIQPSNPNQMGTGASIQPDSFNQMDIGSHRGHQMYPEGHIPLGNCFADQNLLQQFLNAYPDGNGNLHMVPEVGQ